MLKINKSKGLSPTELRKRKKMKLQEEEEILDQVGSETESEGRKATQELMDKRMKEEKKKEDDALNYLDMRRKNMAHYREIVQYALHQLVENIGMPRTYRWGVWYDGRGIVLAIIDKKGILHRRQCKVLYNPVYDRNAVKTFALWAEDVYDKCEGNLQSDLWIPPKAKMN